MDQGSDQAKRIECWTVDDPNLDKALDEIIRPTKMDHSDARGLKRIIGLVRDHLCGRTVAVERDYIDADYQGLYSMWYSKSFKPYPSLCSRLHFFSREVTDDDLKNGTVGDSDYLGFCCLTPLTCGRVGRTVIRRWHQRETHDGFELHPEVMTSPSYAHIYGKRYKVYGFPYISQDSMVMVCAQSAIWMTLLYLHTKYGRYGVRRSYPHEITEAASRYLPWGGRILPAGGLTVQHMANALTNLGLTAILDMRQDDPNGKLDEKTQDNEEKQKWNPQNWIMKYLDSEIPVILSTDKPQHALVSVGALHSNKMIADVEKHQVLVSMEAWVAGLVVNDDARGTYRVMPSNGKLSDLLDKSNYKNLLPNDKTWWRSLDDVDGVIVPLPQEVSIQARHIDDIIAEVLADDDENFVCAHLNTELGKGNDTLDYILDILNKSGETDQIVTRAYLVRSMEFLKRLRSDGFPEVLREYYNNQQYPQYIWVVELMIRSEIDGKSPEERQIVGEIIIDSTANHQSLSLLHVHICGVAIRRDVNTEKPQKEFLGVIEPYASSRPKYLWDGQP